MTTNRMSQDYWEAWEEDDGNTCARCGAPLDLGPTIQEILRCVAMEYGGLCIQAVGVHRVCWEERRGEASFLMAHGSPQALAGWNDMVLEMRAEVARRRKEEEEGEEWNL